MTKESQDKTSGKSRQYSGAKTIFIALVPFAVLAGMIAFLLGPGQSMLNTGIPLPEITIERIEFQEGMIVAFIRNTGPIDVVVAQADVNDRIVPAAIEPSKNLSRLAEAKVIIPFAWTEGEPYEIGITTFDGVRFGKNVEAAALAPKPTVEQASFFALIGTYVGIIPVLIGLLWFPFIRRLGTNKYNFFLSLTAGLLVFLGIDALIEGSEVATENVASVFGGQVLMVMVTILSFLVLSYTSGKLIERAKNTVTGSSFYARQFVKPVALSLMIAIGIGLHNFGEGLAIGSAMLLGQVALSTFLIIGFTLHNTTEGLAIVAPMAKNDKIMIRKLVVMGLIAGFPTIVGAWIGGFLYSPIATIIFLSIGAGAIFQVVFSIYSWMANTGETKTKRSLLTDISIIAGFIAGMVIMYTTGLLVPS